MECVCLAALRGTDPAFDDQWVCDMPITEAWLLRETKRQRGYYPTMALAPGFQTFLDRAVPYRYNFKTDTTPLACGKRLPAYVLILRDKATAARIAFWLRDKPRWVDCYLFDSYFDYVDFAYGSAS